MKTRIGKGRTRADKKDEIKAGKDRINYGKGSLIAAGIDGNTVYVHKENNV